MNFTPNKTYANAGVLTFTTESHTMGNLLRFYLMQNPDVQFAGYKVPHPLISEMVLKIVGGDKQVLDLVVETCDVIVNDIDSILESLE